MTFSVEALRGREDSPGGKPKRFLVREKVVSVLDTLGIGTRIEPHIERLTREFTTEITPSTGWGLDANGYLTSDTTLPGMPAMGREKAISLAKSVAPVELATGIGEQLKECGVYPRTAIIIGRIAAGEKVKEIALDYELTPSNVYRIIDVFVESMSSERE